MELARLSLRLVFVLMLVGCSGYAPNAKLIGQDRKSVIQSLGQPERETVSPSGKKLHFPRGPAGSHTYFIDLDNDDRVIGFDQVLTEERFALITVGMSRDEVIELIGVSKITHGLARQRGYVWHYRYFTDQCKSFVIEFTQTDTVRGSGYIIRSRGKCKYVGQG